MRVYHRTFSAEAIAEQGFRDAEGTYGTRRRRRGVWVSDTPLGINEGAEGDAVLVIEVPEPELLDYEWAEDLKTYREFLVPAGRLNSYPIIEVLRCSESD